MSTIFNVFSQSPFGMLAEHMQEVVYTVDQLEPLFLDVMREDWEKVGEHRQAIADKESAADEVKKRLYLSLQSDLFLPVARNDVLALVQSQDSIANQAKDIAGIIYGRQLCFPKPVHALLRAYVHSALVACQQAHHTVKELDTLRMKTIKYRYSCVPLYGLWSKSCRRWMLFLCIRFLIGSVRWQIILTM